MKRIIEKFSNIACSIEELDVYNAYQIVRLDIQLNKNENRFHAFLVLEGISGPDQINIEILPDCSFHEVWREETE